MKHRCLFFGIIFITLFSCGKQNKGEIFHVIDIGSAMESRKEFSISEFADNISYVALETTDNSILGDHPDVVVWNDKIIVSSLNQPLKVFDKKTGHFCNCIGHIGDDPEGLSSDGQGNIPFWIDNVNGTVYLRALGNLRLLRYRLDGTFLGSVMPVFNNLELKNLFFYFFHISNDIITAHNKTWNDKHPYVFSFNAINGDILDTIPSIVQPFPLGGEISYYNYGTSSYNNNGGGVYHFIFSNNRTARIVPNNPSVWEYNGQICLKESFIDTIYSIQGHSLSPRLIFDLGKWEWPYEKRFEKDESQGRISISYILENEHFFYFILHTGLYEKRKSYCGFFNKKDGTIKIKDGIEITDDINNFLPVTIRKVSSDGEYIGLIQVYEIMEWNEKNKNKILNAKIQSLIKKDVEDNPIVILIKSI